MMWFLLNQMKAGLDVQASCLEQATLRPQSHFRISFFSAEGNAFLHELLSDLFAARMRFNQ